MKAVAEKRKVNAEMKRKQLEKDKKRATELSLVLEGLDKDLGDVQNEYLAKTAPHKEEYDNKVEPFKKLFEGKASTIMESMDAAKKELLEIGDRQKNTLFDIKGNWNFDNGYYLHKKQETIVKTGDGFDLSKFVKKFSEYIKWSFKVAPLTKLMTDADARKRSKIDAFEIELGSKQTLEIKRLAAAEKEVD